ncbi:MAG: hypothetical protein A4E35_01469 [Methanoregula sp. PtaU1.Bin051]|nr:MAG: hypothetical protein A4E35_01469 [Methanoregula sp. PtaU1.Bin051]
MSATIRLPMSWVSPAMEATIAVFLAIPAAAEPSGTRSCSRLMMALTAPVTACSWATEIFPICQSLPVSSSTWRSTRSYRSLIMTPSSAALMITDSAPAESPASRASRHDPASAEQGSPSRMKKRISSCGVDREPVPESRIRPACFLRSGGSSVSVTSFRTARRDET